MIQHQTVEENPQSGKGVAKGQSRFSATFWQSKVYRPRYRDGSGNYVEVAECYARLQHAGRREAVGLGTNNVEEAGRKASKLYQLVRTKGWDAALLECCPDRAAPKNMGTVGGYLKCCEPLFDGTKTTWTNYAYALRKIAAEITGKHVGDQESKFDPFHKSWQHAVDDIPLSALTFQSIDKWKRDCVARAGASHVGQQKARRNVNSFLLNARTLFGKKMVARLKLNQLPPPEVNPFEDVALEKSGSTKYVSTIKAADLIQHAKAELEDRDPQAYKVILLALGAGLRRGEIDMLSRAQLNFKESVIGIIATEHFEGKTVESEDLVYVDPSMLEEIKRNMGETDSFVIDTTIAPAHNRAPGYYRCDETFGRVTRWLVANGVKGTKPLHTLRKEFGSLINAATDIHTASRQLRHATIKITAANYTDNRRRPASAVPIGAMLTSEKKAVNH